MSRNRNLYKLLFAFFIDDLQEELNATSIKEPIELNTDREPDTIEARFKSYLKEHLSFQINDTQEEFDYIGKEYSDNMAVFYLEIPEIDTIQKLSIQNKLLNFSFSEQENIVKTKNIQQTQEYFIYPRKDICFNKLLTIFSVDSPTFTF